MFFFFFFSAMIPPAFPQPQPDLGFSGDGWIGWMDGCWSSCDRDGVFWERNHYQGCRLWVVNQPKHFWLLICLCCVFYVLCTFVLDS